MSKAKIIEMAIYDEGILSNDDGLKRSKNKLGSQAIVGDSDWNQVSYNVTSI